MEKNNLECYYHHSLTNNFLDLFHHLLKCFNYREIDNGLLFYNKQTHRVRFEIIEIEMLVIRIKFALKR